MPPTSARSPAAVLPLLLVALAGRLVAGAAPSADACDALGPRVACGGLGVSQRSCEAQGCCFDANPIDYEAWQPDVYLPTCFYPNAGDSEYSLGAGDITNGTLTNLTTTQPELGSDILNLTVRSEELTPTIFHIKINDANTTTPRWEVPRGLFVNGSLLSAAPFSAKAPQSTEYDLEYSDDPFGFVVISSQTGRATFNSSGLRLVFKPQYLELSTWVSPDALIFGGGERSSETGYMTRNGYPYTQWNRDQNPQVPMRNTYGDWPFALVLEADGSAWGAALLNSNGMDMVATPDRLSWRAVGGIIDLYVFTGPTPLDVVDQMTQVVGRPAMQPFWAFGFHQCRYGYNSIWEVEEVVANYSAAGIPLETMWTDIDYMDGYRVFTFNETSFPTTEVQRFLGQLHDNTQKWVPIVDPGIKVDTGFGPYEAGVAQDVFLKGVDGSDYLAWVWPGGCNFPDWYFNPQAESYWEEQLAIWHDNVTWDGLWIDMNEFANFCGGDICQMPTEQAQANQAGWPNWMCQLMCFAPTSSGLSTAQQGIISPPYSIANSLQALPLDTKAASVLAVHKDGTLQYDSHNLMGMAEARSTHSAIQAIKGERPFVLTRSTYLGSGAYAGHWTGDNNASWADLQWSITGLVNSGLAGIPMVGADICGFSSNTTEELCNRWISLGAFYPFSRDHSEKGTLYQELYRWESVADSGRRALALRYQLLPFYYSLAQQAYETGAPIFRSPWINFPTDPNTHLINKQFMVGDALLGTPVLTPNTTNVTGYFPQGAWYSLWEDASSSDDVDARSDGRNATLDSPLGTIPLHLGGGAIVPLAAPGANLTADTLSNPITLVVALPDYVASANASASSDGNGTTLRAAGYMYLDDGVSMQVSNSCCNFLTFTANVTSNQSAVVELRFGRPDQQGQQCNASGAQNFSWPPLAGLQVFGWQANVANARLEVLPSSGSGAPTYTTSLQTDTDGRQAVLSLPAGQAVELTCPEAVRITWSARSTA